MPSLLKTGQIWLIQFNHYPHCLSESTFKTMAHRISSNTCHTKKLLHGLLCLDLLISELLTYHQSASITKVKPVMKMYLFLQKCVLLETPKHKRKRLFDGTAGGKQSWSFSFLTGIFKQSLAWKGLTQCLQVNCLPVLLFLLQIIS